MQLLLSVALCGFSLLASGRPRSLSALDAQHLSPRVTHETTVKMKEEGGPFPLYDYACKSPACINKNGTVEENEEVYVTCQLKGVDGESNFYKVGNDGRYISEAHVQPHEDGFLAFGPDDFKDLGECWLELRYYSEELDQDGDQESSDIHGAPGECMPVEAMYEDAPIDGYVKLDNQRDRDDKINFCWMYQDAECSQKLNGPNTELGGHNPRVYSVDLGGGLGDQIKAYKCW